MLSGGWGSGEPGLLDLAVPSARFNPDCAAITVWTIAGFAAGSVAMKREQCSVRSIGALGREGLADHLPSLRRPSRPFSRDAPLGHNLPLGHHRADTRPSTTASRHTLHITIDAMLLPSRGILRPAQRLAPDHYRPSHPSNRTSDGTSKRRKFNGANRYLIIVTSLLGFDNVATAPRSWTATI